jgi:hypothetical protein
MFIAIPSSKDREYYIPENDQMLNHQNSLILHVLLDTPFSMCEGGGGGLGLGRRSFNTAVLPKTRKRLERISNIKKNSLSIN